MSNDLISRKAVLEELESLRVALTGISCRKEYQTTQKEIMNSVIRIIEEHPTAFDKEKVSEQIRERVSDCYLEYCGKYNNCLQCRADEAVKIVEKGGIE